MLVTDRIEMFSRLTKRMSGAYDDLATVGKLSSTSNLVKSYIVESHRGEDRTASTADWARSAFEKTGLRGVKELSVLQTEDDELFTIEATTGRGAVEIYVDTSNPRYWFAHSVSRSDVFDQFMTKVVHAHPSLDRAWFSSELLDEAAAFGQFRGLGLDFDRRMLWDSADTERSEEPALKMQLWGTHARDVLNTLRSANAFPGETTLSKVRVRYRREEALDDLFVLDDVKWDGKTTARGTDFESHHDLLTRLARLYGSNVEAIEKRYWLRTDPDDSAGRFLGEPITFRFGAPIPDVDRFCEALFSAREPFRLWGAPARSTDEMVRVHAVDMHIGAPLTFEICAGFFRLYVPAGTCGNSVLRLFANLQHYYDARVSAFDSNGESVVALQP